MNRELIEDLHQYFEQKTKPTSDENYLLTRLIGKLPYFPISSVCRDDLERKGFDVSDVTDSQMKELAAKLGDDYCEQLFWTSVEIIAEDRLGIPRYICPKCGKKASLYNPSEQIFHCCSCENIWKKEEPTGLYVLVEFPENPTFFEEHELGYPCFNSDDNGAMYVPEHIYRAHFGREPQANSLYRPIQWPESQIYFEIEPESTAALCEPIEADAKALEDFGSSSIWVPLCLIEK